MGSVPNSTRAATLEASRFTLNKNVRGSGKFKLQSDTKTTSMDDSSSHVRPQQYRLLGDGMTTPPATVTDRSTKNSENCETQLMYPGETTGEMGLIMNHSQPGSIQSVTYVECASLIVPRSSDLCRVTRKTGAPFSLICFATASKRDNFRSRGKKSVM